MKKVTIIGVIATAISAFIALGVWIYNLKSDIRNWKSALEVEQDLHRKYQYMYAKADRAVWTLKRELEQRGMSWGEADDVIEEHEKTYRKLFLGES